MISPYVISVSVHKDGNVLQPATFEVVNKFFHRLSWRLIICEIEPDTKIASLKERIMSQRAGKLGSSIFADTHANHVTRSRFCRSDNDDFSKSYETKFIS